MATSVADIAIHFDTSGGASPVSAMNTSTCRVVAHPADGNFSDCRDRAVIKHAAWKLSGKYSERAEVVFLMNDVPDYDGNFWVRSSRISDAYGLDWHLVFIQMVTCIEGYYRVDSSRRSCRACPRGAVCKGGSEPPYAQKGFYQFFPESDAIYACKTGNCAGTTNVTSAPDSTLSLDLQCTEGARGHLCSTCEEKWWLNSETRKCIKCGDKFTVRNWVSIAVVIIVLVLVLRGEHLKRSNFLRGFDFERRAHELSSELIRRSDWNDSWALFKVSFILTFFYL